MAFSQLLFSAVRPPDAQALSNEMSKKGRTQSISSITTMDQAFGQFGFESGDTVSRRDQIVMYHTLMGTSKQSLAELIARNMYDDASELRDRIPVLRESSMQMQRDQEQQRQTLRHMKE
jgi:protein-arginine kinase activator protein McsA